MGAKIIHSDPEILDGIPVFVGTRVPVKNLYDYIETGDTVDDFINDFDGITKEQAIQVLEMSRLLLNTQAGGV